MKFNTCVIRLSTCLFFTTSAINCMEDASQLTKRAWQQAFDGQDAAALTNFVQAANENDLEATKFLAYNYGTEALLGEPHKENAQFFTQQAETLTAAKKQSERFYSDYSAQLKLESNVAKLKSLRFAKSNRWHQQVLQELNETSTKLSGNSDEYPLPEDALIKLFEKMNCNSETDVEKIEMRMKLLNEGMQRVKSKETTVKILMSLNDRYRKFCVSNNPEVNYHGHTTILQNLNNISLELGLSAELSDAYAKFTGQCYGDYLGNGQTIERLIIVDALKEIFPAYVAIDQSNALKSLTYFLDHDAKYYYAGNCNFLHLLALLSPQEVNNYVAQCASKSKHFLPNVIETLCKNPDVAQKFNGTSLDLDSLATKSLDTSLDERSLNPEECVELTSFFKHGGTQFYQKYHDAIVAVLPSYVQTVAHQYDAVIPMVTQQKLPDLQEAAIQALLACNDAYWETCILEGLLNNKNIQENQQKLLYMKMNQVYQAEKRIKPLQKLWMHLKNNAAHNHFLYNSIVQYFCAPYIVDSTDKNEEFSLFFNKILKIARTQATLPEDQFIETLKIAHETGLSAIIDPEFLQAEKDRVIFDEQATFTQRATFLDQRLLMIRTSNDIIDLFQKIENEATDHEFKTYVNNIFTTLQTGRSSFELCRAKKVLQKTHKKYDMSSSIPQMVFKNAGGHLENFSYHHYSNENDKPHDRISLKSDLKKIHIDSNGLIYGVKYDCNNQENPYSLCAIDRNSLDAVWQIPMTNDDRNQHHFTVVDDILYTAVGSCLRAFDKKTGMQVNKITLPQNAPVTSLMVDAAGILYIAQETGIVTSVNPQTYQQAVFDGDTGKGQRDYFIAQNLFGYYAEGSILLYSNNGLVHTIKMQTYDNFFDPTIIAHKNNSQLLYVDNNQVVCFDTDTLTEKWRYPLENNIKGQPYLSENGEYIFITTVNNQIIALKNNSNSAQILWNIQLPKKHSFNVKEFSIALGPDDKIIFCLEENYGDLYKIDLATGTIISESKCEEGRTRRLLGISLEGLPYIHGLHF